MIDYNALKALEAVIELQSFEQASRKINISQSAITQRIQNFEAYLGNKLLIRKSPYKPTETGEKYLNLLRKVNSLENELTHEGQSLTNLKIAINRDSLDLYFSKILTDKELAKSITLQIIADDQDKTLEYLKSGQVDICISSCPSPLSNHSATYLGDMSYRLVCSKEFYQRYFSWGSLKESLMSSPLVVFDNSDKVQHTFLSKEYGIETFSKINFMPTVASFKSAIVGGYGYGLLPEIDIDTELKNKTLINISKKKSFRVPLYLHHWEYQSDINKLFIERVLRASKGLRASQ